MEFMVVHNGSSGKPPERYDEKKIGKVTYKVSSVYLGETSLKNSMENFVVRKVMDEINAGARETVNA